MAAMRGGTVTVLLGVTAFAAYSLGHRDAPATYEPVALASVPPIPAKPVVFVPAVTTPSAAPDRSPRPESKHTVEATPASAPDTSPKPESKRKVGAVLTAAAITAIIIQVSRDQYHAGGRPCACPDDSMRNGRACGGRSAYSRPGGAAPLCYPTDVTAAMIESYT
jgi:hypothetical protein